MKKLNALRRRIDTIDAHLLQLIASRADLAKTIAALKKKQSDSAPLYRPEREAQVMRRLLKHNPGPLSDKRITVIFREIMSACLSLEQPIKIAYLGPAGTFTQEAALKQFGRAAAMQTMTTLDQVFENVATHRSHYGVVPIENSSEGGVTHTLDLLINSPLKICGEVELRVHHCLLSGAKRFSEIECVYAHQQTFAQCRNWLEAHLGKARHITTASNAAGVKLAKRKKRAAAIASKVASEIYALPVLSKNIEDSSHNTTRFLVLGHNDTPPSGHDKTSLLFATPNRAGSLHRMLSHLAAESVSMTRIESRPSQRAPWDYLFFVDLEGHAHDPAIARVIAELQREAPLVKWLGSYPKALP